MSTSSLSRRTVALAGSGAVRVWRLTPPGRTVTVTQRAVGGARRTLHVAGRVAGTRKARRGRARATAADRLGGALNLFVGVGAIGGAAYALGGAEDWDPAWLEDSPFEDFTVPGLVLGFVQAPIDLAAGWALWRGGRLATPLALASGAVQVGWIATQFRLIGYRSPLQPIFGVLGATSLALALRRSRRA